MHNILLTLHHKPCLVLTAAMGALGVDRVASGTMAPVALDWNQIIIGLIALAAAYVGYLTHKTKALAEAIDKRVDVVSADLEKTKDEMSSQITEALATVLAKGLLDGAEGERKRQVIEQSNITQGVREEKVRVDELKK